MEVDICAICGYPADECICEINSDIDDWLDEDEDETITFDEDDE